MTTVCISFAQYFIGMNERKDTINPSKNYKKSCRVAAFCKMREKIILAD